MIVGRRFQVLFHSAHRGSFHLSLTVLVHYRSSRVFSLGRWTSQLPTGLACPVVLRNTGQSLPVFAYGTVTLCGLPFQYSSANRQICNSYAGSYNPATHNAWRFGLFRVRSPLLAECSVFLGLLRCFSSPGSPPLVYVFNQGIPED